MKKSSYSVELTLAADKELAALIPYVKEAADSILELEENPNAGHPLKGDLHSFKSLEFTLPGSGHYRAAYLILEHKKICLVFAIGPHEGFYEHVKQRAKAIRKRYPKH